MQTNQHYVLSTHWHVWHGAFTCVTWHIRTWDVAHSRIFHDSFKSLTKRIHCITTHSHVWVACVTWLTLMYDNTLTCMTWPIHTCDMIPWWVIMAWWLTHTCDITHSYVWHTHTLHAIFRAFQCVAVCYSVLQCVAVRCSVTHTYVAYHLSRSEYHSHVCYSVLQCVAVCCSVLQFVAVCCSFSHTLLSISECHSLV